MLPFGIIDDKRDMVQDFQVVELEHVSFDTWMRS